MARRNGSYKIRYEDWQRRKSRDGSCWDIRDWLKRCCEGFENFVLQARGRQTEHFSDFDHWKAVPLFEALAFYGLYGAVFNDPDPEEANTLIESQLREAESMVKHAIAEDDAVPRSILNLARSRRAIDIKQGVVDVASLATLADRSAGRIQNLMSGKDAILPAVDGGIPPESAATWLAGRAEFWPSIWREPKDAPDIGHRLRVPVASDGTVFHPSFVVEVATWWERREQSRFSSSTMMLSKRCWAWRSHDGVVLIHRATGAL